MMTSQAIEIPLCRQGSGKVYNNLQSRCYRDPQKHHQLVFEKVNQAQMDRKLYFELGKISLRSREKREAALRLLDLHGLDLTKAKKSNISKRNCEKSAEVLMK